MINQSKKTRLVDQARTLLWRLNRNRSRAKQSKKATTTLITKLDTLIVLANKRLERRINLRVHECAEPASGQKTRNYRIK